jgi:hypothetical protein
LKHGNQIAYIRARLALLPVRFRFLVEYVAEAVAECEIPYNDKPMAASHNLDKLRRLLGKPLTEEAHVAYALVLTRKIVESIRKADKTRYGALYFFCHWVLHDSLDTNWYIPTFVDLFDLRDGMELEEYFKTEFFQKMLYFRQFKLDLRLFLKEHDLPDQITTQNEQWADFIYLYSDLISGSPLTGAQGLPKSVEKIEVIRMPQPGSAIEMVHWTISMTGRAPFTAWHMYPVRRLLPPPLFRYLIQRTEL